MSEKRVAWMAAAWTEDGGRGREGGATLPFLHRYLLHICTCKSSPPPNVPLKTSTGYCTCMSRLSFSFSCPAFLFFLPGDLAAPYFYMYLFGVFGEEIMFPKNFLLSQRRLPSPSQF